MPKHTGFRIGQLVRVVNPRHFAYGRLAMVMMGGKPTQVKPRFADLPKMVEPTDAPRTGVIPVETFNNDQLETNGTDISRIKRLA